MTTTDEAHKKNLAATEADGVQCMLDDTWVHSIPAYLKVVHPDVTVEAYQQQFPNAPLYSQRLEAARQAREAEKMHAATDPISLAEVRAARAPSPPSRQVFAKVFDLGSAAAAKNKRGDDIMIDVLGDPDPEISGYIPEVDDNYVYNIDLLKALMMGIQMNKPTLLWGHYGTGKTTLAEQYCARTRRPAIRIQHTISTEEAHILGQFILVGKETVFNPGPLAYAMRYGLVYIADEYDFALPAVLSVYQPVLEGKALVIKEACPEWRVVRPHPNFRFIATGNTNGGGDDTGLYQGTQMQNAANYSRFGITVQVPYMDEKLETAVITSQSSIDAEDSKQLVRVGNMVRDAYARGDLGVTISPRELINAGQLGRALGGDWRGALSLAYTNRLNAVDREAVNQMINRVFAA